ncbi:aminotransferase class I/II-fold pyridoxal phosphate-dependent enzyme [Krasilnikovia sp. MM14-A1259]|uniref:aminotransferase class I/II-fold pyridoxal phosphate-dependent enzyme n=1 Tax=Krasilnikovia sp. MM14-A1259 TaxID=3373539 RepID=UPI00380A8932
MTDDYSLLLPHHHPFGGESMTSRQSNFSQGPAINDDIFATLRRQFAGVLGDALPNDATPECTLVELGVSSVDATTAIAATLRELRVRIPLSTMRIDMPLGQLVRMLEQAVSRRNQLALLEAAAKAPPDPYELTLDAFAVGTGAALSEVDAFSRWQESLRERDTYPFEAPHVAELRFSTYDYLGYAHHPAVIAQAKTALDAYGLGAAASPVIGGTLPVHQALEAALITHFGLPGRAISLFSSGYGANLGTVSALVRAGHTVVCDRSAHISIFDGAKLSGATIRYFEHNDPQDLARVLQSPACRGTRVLVCVEGIYSADGDHGRVADLLAVAHRHGARLLVDEAHSMLVAGAGGRGVCEEQGVLDEVDMIVMTLSKAFGGVGGALWAREPIARYVNWYARCRAFSCALDPAVAGGLVCTTTLAAGADGAGRRTRVRDNARRLRAALEGRVDVGTSRSWVVPVRFGDERKAIPITDWLQRRGLDVGVLTFPAVPSGEARLRMFVTSEHTPAQIDGAAGRVIEAARHFGFGREALS